MKRSYTFMPRVAIATVLTLMLSACENTLYFSERTVGGVDVSLAQPGTPVELTAGYKRRVTTFVPPKEQPENYTRTETAKGEALSMVSRFSLGYDDAARKAYALTAFAAGQAASPIAADPAAQSALLDQRVGEYQRDACGDALQKFINPKDDSTAAVRAADANRGRLNQWMTANGVTSRIPFFLRNKDDAVKRCKAMVELGAS